MPFLSIYTGLFIRFELNVKSFKIARLRCKSTCVCGGEKLNKNLFEAQHRGTFQVLWVAM